MMLEVITYATSAYAAYNLLYFIEYTDTDFGLRNFRSNIKTLFNDFKGARRASKDL